MISIIHPSRSRPLKSIQTIKKWVSRAAALPLDIIVSLDSDDKDLALYKELYSFMYARVIVNPNKSSVQAVNVASKIARGDIMIVVSDDFDCPQNWDFMIQRATMHRSDWVLKVYCGIQKHIITLPIFDRVYFDRFGYVYHPSYDHNFCDTEFTEVAHLLNRVIERNDITFTHLHPEATGEVKDDLYLRNDKTHDIGRKIFQERQRINFGLCI